MTVTSDYVRSDVSCTDDVRIQTREIGFVDVLVGTNTGRGNEPAKVGVVERAHRFEKLVALRLPRH